MKKNYMRPSSSEVEVLSTRLIAASLGKFDQVDEETDASEALSDRKGFGHSGVWSSENWAEN
ncbi:MAG: hypothetical protein J1F06_03855 [Prevotellaceae bacterium]|nr:hypothetical protein [Prevotellaceae bacterium]